MSPPKRHRARHLKHSISNYDLRATTFNKNSIFTQIPFFDREAKHAVSDASTLTPMTLGTQNEVSEIFSEILLCKENEKSNCLKLFQNKLMQATTKERITDWETRMKENWLKKKFELFEFLILPLTSAFMIIFDVMMTSFCNRKVDEMVIKYLIAEGFIDAAKNYIEESRVLEGSMDRFCSWKTDSNCSLHSSFEKQKRISTLVWRSWLLFVNFAIWLNSVEWIKRCFIFKN